MKRIFEVCQSWVLHLDRLHPCLLTLPPGRRRLQFILESPTKVKQRQVDRLNKSPPEFNDQPLAAGTNFPLCGNITTATK